MIELSLIEQRATFWMGWAGVVLLGAGLPSFVLLSIARKDSFLAQAWKRYVRYLEKEVRFQLWQVVPHAIARLHLATVALVFAALPLGFPFPFAVMALVILAGLPFFYLTREHDRRVISLEEMLDQWLLMVANNLKASSSLGEAIESSARLIRKPLSEEIDLIIKEMRLGTPVDQALQNASVRIGSPTVSGALATLMIARQTGGDLPAVLERSAAALREMQRLEGVVRTKTAENKSQGFVMAAMPFVLIGGFSLMDPMWLKPLFADIRGYIVLTVAVFLWLGGVLWARKILAVDI